MLRYSSGMRIGVVADTHSPEFLPELPPQLFERLAGVDLILHAGDVGGRETLARLRQLAPVEAVRGDHDGQLTDLPRTLELEAAGRRVAVVHGNRSRLIEEPVTFANTVGLGHLRLRPGLRRALRRRFPRADVIVYGHTHAARAEVFKGALLFNPGAVYQVDPTAVDRRLGEDPDWFEWSWLQVMRHRRRTPPPSVGILELGAGPPIATVLPVD